MCTASRRISKSIILQYRSNRRGDEQCWQHCSNVQRWQRAVVAGGDRSGLSGRCTLGYSLGYCPLQTRILRLDTAHCKQEYCAVHNCTLGYSLGYCAPQTRILRSAKSHTGIIALLCEVTPELLLQYNILQTGILTSAQLYIKIHKDTHVHCRTLDTLGKLHTWK